jgi:hypothetical protein
MAANIACCCSFSLCGSFAEPFGPSTGEPGRLLNDDGREYEYDDTLCFPDKSAESAVPPYADAEGKLGLLDAEKYNGRRFDASPEFDAVDDDDMW